MKKIILLFLIYFSLFAAGASASGNYLVTPQLNNTQVNTSNTFAAISIDNLSIYPNPVVDLLKISFYSNKQGKTIISLFNNIGKQVFVSESKVDAGNNLISIDVRKAAIEPGIYFVQIVIEKEVFTRKLIVK